jgi:hypothetical protein
MKPFPPELGVLLGGVALAIACSSAACSTSDSDDGPRKELAGESGLGGLPVVEVGGFGGLGGSGGAGPATTSTGTNSATVGTGVGGACIDPLEPNDIEAQASDLGSFNDCDDSGSMVQGVLDGVDDVDWYRYVGSDDFGCVVDPTRLLTATHSLRLCKFAECTDGSTASVSCTDGSSPATSPDGRPGCCHTLSFGMDVDCDAVSDDATIYIRLDTPGDACVVYDLEYHY